MRGCLKNFFTGVGCVTLVALAVVAAWHFREDLVNAYRSLRGGQPESPPEFTVGYTSPDQLRSAEEKEAAIARRGGPARIVLSADEMASLVRDRLTPAARAALDSIRVRLERDRFSIEAQLLTEVFGRDMLGPLQGMLDPREPIRISGPAEVRAPGVIAWRVDEFVVSSFPFPGPAIPLLVDRLTGGSDGAILIAVPATVGGLRVRADGVTFIRRTD